MSEINEEQEKQEVATVEPEQPEQPAPVEIYKPPLTKKNKGLITASSVLLVVSIFISFFLTELFAANIDILSAHDLSVLVVIITIPFFIIVFGLNLLTALPAFGMALANAIDTKFRNPICVVLFALTLIEMLYPVVLFIYLIYGHPGGSGTSSSSIESVEDVSSAAAFLI